MEIRHFGTSLKVPELPKYFQKCLIYLIHCVISIRELLCEMRWKKVAWHISSYECQKSAEKLSMTKFQRFLFTWRLLMVRLNLKISLRRLARYSFWLQMSLAKEARMAWQPSLLET